jgi:5-formyltetrahydrofolate cyclo-ligase
MQTIKEEKVAVRALVNKLKANFSDDEKLFQSENVFVQLEQLEAFKTAKTIFAYWSLPDEVKTHNFIKKWHGKKKIILPLVNGDSLELREYSGEESLEKGASFGILEPHKGVIADISRIDIAIIPGIAFDKNGNRLGRGKGYYDKLLVNSNFLKIGLCYSFQMLSKVPADVFDIKMDMVISPK